MEIVVGVTGPQKCNDCGCFHIMVSTINGVYVKDIEDEDEAITEFKNLLFQSTLYNTGRLN